MDNKIIQKVKSKKKILNYIFYLYLITLSIFFSAVGIFSFLNIKNLSFFYTNQIIFFPQGITISIYGIIGILSSLILIKNVNLKLGKNLNKIDKEKIILIKKNFKKRKNIKLKIKVKFIIQKKYFIKK